MIRARQSLRLGLCAAVAVLLGAQPAFSQGIQFVSGSTTPLVQLTGEHFQIQADDVYFSAPTSSATLSRYGVVGTDLGHSLVFPDKIVFFFGDTVGAYRTGDRYYVSRGNPAGTGDSIGYIPNVDWSQCRYIGDVADQLAKGVRSPSVNPDACPTLRFFTNPLRGVDEHVFKPFVISGLAPDESQGTFRVPTSAIAYDDRVYVFATTKFQDARPLDHFWLQSIVAKSDQSPIVWSDTNPPTFSKLYTVTSHATIDDPANPPDAKEDAGKLMSVRAVVMDVGAIADAGLTRNLPRELQIADVAFLWGSSWHATLSNLYLAAVSMRDIEAGTAKWFYYAGNNRWSSTEKDAVELLATNDLTHHAVAWNAELGRFVLMRGAEGKIVAQFSTAPWGPWSTPVTVFSRADEWFGKLLHRPGADGIVQSLVPIYNRDGSRVEMPDGDTGVPYSPNVIDKFTRNADGSVTLYYTLSTWNPYQVLLMSSTFRKVPSPGR